VAQRDAAGLNGSDRKPSHGAPQSRMTPKDVWEVRQSSRSGLDRGFLMDALSARKGAPAQGRNRRADGSDWGSIDRDADARAEPS
jgi:hypothetical protein